MTGTVAVVTPPGTPLDSYDVGEFDVTLVPDATAVDVSAVECVVLRIGGEWEDAARALGERAPSLPVLLVGEGSPGAAARASRLGVEYATEDALAATGESLAERIAEACDTASSGPSDRDRTALADLHEIATLDTDLASKLDELLRVGCTYLDLDVGVSAELGDGDDPLRVNAAVGQAAPRIGSTFGTESRFAATLDGEDVVSVADAAADSSGLRTYVGATIRVEGEPFGVLCFGSAAPRPEGYTDAEREFVELLVRWTGYEFERVTAEQEIRAARNEVQRTLDRIGDGFIGLDAEWRLTYLNDGGRQVVEAAGPGGEGPVTGRRLWDVAPALADTPFEGRLREALDTGESVTFEQRFEPLDTWFEVRAFPADEGLSVFFADAAERKAYERALNGLLSTTEELMTAGDRERIAEVVSDAAADVLDLGFNTVRLYDEERDLLVPTTFSETARMEVDGAPLHSPGEGLSGTAYERGEPVAFDEIAGGIPDAYGSIRSAYAVPLGEHGVLSIGSYDPAGPDERTRTLASVLAANATAAMDRAVRETRLERYRAVHEAVEQRVYVLDEEGSIVLTTDRLLSELGYEESEVVGHPVRDFIGEEATQRGMELLGELSGEPPTESRSYETTLTTADGEEVPVEIELSRFPDSAGIEGSVGIVRDRSQLEAERSRFAGLFDRLPDAVVDAVVTEDGAVVQRVNETFADTFGVDAETADGTPLRDLVVPDDRDSVGLADAEDDLVGPVEVERETAEGRRTFLFRAVRYGVTDEGPLVFGIYTDITDRKEDQRLIAMLNRVFRHNIANTNGVVEGYLEILAQRLDGDNATYANNALGAAGRINEIAGKLRDIERAIDGGRGETGDLRAVVDGAVAEVGASHPGASFSVNVPSVPVPDRDLFATAVQEILENAGTHAGDAPEVQVRGTVHGDEVTLRVTDDGPGVPERERAVVSGTVDITQLDHSRGLGLWLVRHVCRTLGGRLDFEDDGSTVVVTIARAS